MDGYEEWFASKPHLIDLWKLANISRKSDMWLTCVLCSCVPPCLGSESVVNISEKEKTVQVKQAGDEIGRSFTYDYVYGVNSTQQQVYDESAFSLVESVLEGYNGKYPLSIHTINLSV